MTIARKHLIDYQQTCFYHCMSRCVRQGYLLSANYNKTEQYSYRHDWIERRLLLLADVFAIDVYSFAIMDNHTHTVLHANVKLAKQWSDTEVLKRWTRIGKIPLLCQIYLSKDWRQHLNEIELDIIKEKIAEFRKKLTDISSFMRYLNYYIARRANKEDGVTGHFWEGRFISQALLDVDAVLACMAYVDLNPRRAGKASSLINSKNTSIKRRLERSKDQKLTIITPFRNEFPTATRPIFGHLTLEAYTEYIESVYNQQKSDSEIISARSFAEIESNWLYLSGKFEYYFDTCAGTQEDIDMFQKNIKVCTYQPGAEQRALADAILSRLLDDRYPSCNEDLAN